MIEKYSFIHGEEGNYPIIKMCRWAKVSRTGYYEWRTRTPSVTAQRRARLEALIRFEFEASQATYGYRRIHAALARRGHVVDDETVRLVMRDLGLVACQPRPFRPTTTIPAPSATPDLLERDFTACDPGEKLVGDITYIPTREGWLFLATVLDCFSKKVVGYAMADHLRTSLVTDALGMAAKNVKILPQVTIFHSDRGCQYTSQEFADYTDKLGVRRSVGRTGICYDNAWAESFNGTLKVELVNRTTYPTRNKAQAEITRYIELHYNQVRLHSALGYHTPNEIEQAWHQAKTAA